MKVTDLKLQTLRSYSANHLTIVACPAAGDQGSTDGLSPHLANKGGGTSQGDANYAGALCAAREDKALGVRALKRSGGGVYVQSSLLRPTCLANPKNLDVRREY